MPRAPTLLLWLLIVGAMMMPVDYRATTAEAHTHTMFQAMIDVMVGHAHHHARDLLAVHAPCRPGVPVDPSAPREAAPLIGESTSTPDIPIQLGLSMPLLSITALQMLGLLVSLLVAGTAQSPLWGHATTAYRWITGIELPPPRGHTSPFGIS